MAGDAGGSRSPQTRTRTRSWVVVAWIAFFFMIVGLVGWLLSLGSRGDEIAQVLNLLVALVFGLVQVPAAIKMRDAGRHRMPRKPRPWSIALGAGLLAGAIVVALLVWFLSGRADVNVTSDLRLTGAARMSNGSQATIESDRLVPPQRRYLAITLSLHNPSRTGDCVRPAQLSIGLRVDGEPLTLRADPVPSGREVVLDLDAVTRAAQVVVVLQEPDQACEVELVVDRAILYS